MSFNNIGKDPLIGIIMLDTVFPRIPGDIGNPDTFSFPVLYKVVKGANSQRVVIDADPLLLQPFIQAARSLESEGVKAIATSCGFLALFHQELAAAVDIPVVTSSLLQVHLLRNILDKNKKIGVITALSQALTPKHLAGVGLESHPLIVFGMDRTKEFRAVFVEGKKDVDIDKCRQEILSVAEELVLSDPDIGAIVLECTNMPPFSKAIQDRVALPVFDVVTLINYTYSSINQQIFP
jgi:aspartate/glutamate racemase